VNTARVNFREFDKTKILGGLSHPSLSRELRFGAAALAFAIIYLTINTLTDFQQYIHLGITLWSPDNGLSVLIISESYYFAPVVLLSEMISDKYIHHVNHSDGAILLTECALTLSYVLLAYILRNLFGFNVRSIEHKNVVSVISVTPLGAAFAAFMFCSTLYVTGALPGNQFWLAAQRFWIGDAAGMIVSIPAMMAILHVLSTKPWNRLTGKSWATVFFVMILMTIAVTTAIGKESHNHLFYIIFLPIIWVGIRGGFTATALTLLWTEVVLVGYATYLHYDVGAFQTLQTLTFVLAVTGLLLGAVTTDGQQSARLLREKREELARVSAESSARILAVTLAHEISQPLSSISTYVHAIRRMLENGRQADVLVQAARKAEAESERARLIVERVRDFLSTGRLCIEPVDMSEVARKIRDVNLESSRSRGVALDLEVFGVIPEIRADVVAIEQALNNLLINAIDAASSRADAQGRVAIRLARRGDAVTITVSDNGPGVAPGIAETLFEFFQSTKPRGMGLGLPLTLQIARSHSGRLTWQPVVPRGASFIMELPIDGRS
jgi:signal transduction histidine kinase